MSSSSSKERREDIPWVEEEVDQSFNINSESKQRGKSTIKQVLENVICNAIKASPYVGRIIASWLQYFPPRFQSFFF